MTITYDYPIQRRRGTESPVKYWSPSPERATNQTYIRNGSVSLYSFPIVPPYDVEFNTIALSVHTPDTTLTDYYDFGFYDRTGNLIAHTGAQNWTTAAVLSFSLASGSRGIFYKNEPLILGVTGNATTATLNGNEYVGLFYSNASGSTTSGGVLPSTTTLPSITLETNALAPVFLVYTG